MAPRAVRLVNALLSSRSDPPYLELWIGSPLDTGHVAPPQAENHGPLPDWFGTAREDPFGALPVPRRGFISAVLHHVIGRTRGAGRCAFLHQEPAGPHFERIVDRECRQRGKEGTRCSAARPAASAPRLGQVSKSASRFSGATASEPCTRSPQSLERETGRNPILG